MKHHNPQTNYLSRSEKSEYDNLERRVFTLSHQWMDHTAHLHKNACVDQLCDFITQHKFEHFLAYKPSAAASKQDYYLGQIIAIFVELNHVAEQKSRYTEEQKRKRRELDLILDEHYRLNSNHMSDKKVNLSQDSGSNFLLNIDSKPQEHINLSPDIDDDSNHNDNNNEDSLDNENNASDQTSNSLWKKITTGLFNK